MGVGIVGGGDISARYARLLDASPRFRPLAVSVRTPVHAAQASERTGLPAVTLAELLADPAVELVLNLTPPLAHADVTAAALKARRHVYSEKPLAADLAGARRLIRLAERHGVCLACAPATFLGPALQAARQMLDSGGLGQVLSARGAMVYPGPDHWHHAPAALFGPAAGPVFDMGVYHVTALVALLGPVQRVSAVGSRARAVRTVRAGPQTGTSFEVAALTHVETLLAFEAGPSASLTLSFDGIISEGPGLEILGTKGSLSLPQPGQFEGIVRRATRFGQWEDVTPRTSWPDTGWLAGLHSMIDHLTAPDEPVPWPAPQLALHVLEVLTAIDRAARLGNIQTVRTRCERPSSLAPDSQVRWAKALQDEAA